MLRKTLLIAITPAVIALFVSTCWSEEQRKEESETVQTDSSCPVFTTIFKAIARKTGGTCSQAAAAHCKCGADCQCAATTECARGEDCPCTVVRQIVHGDACKCGPGCRCGAHGHADATASAHTAALHRHLVHALTENVELRAQLQVQEEMAQQRVQFHQQMLEKESAIAHLHAQLELAHEKEQLIHQVAGAVVENAKLKAAMQLAQDRHELLKQAVANNNHRAATDVAAAFTKLQAENAKLTGRIVELEAQLETLRVRLAQKPNDSRTE
jgi:hypothetical protein